MRNLFWKLNVYVIAFVAVAIILSMSGQVWADSGDHLWNYRENGDDRFHSNEAWLRPWYGNNESQGQWQGGYSYTLNWGGVSQTGSQSGRLSVSNPRDRQFHAWTYVYVEDEKNISFSGSGDCMPRCFLNYAFGSPRQFTTNLSLNAGWNRVDVTGYNQNDGYSFSTGALAGLVDIMSSTEFDITPVADFTYSPGLGWSGVTEFSFSDNSSGEPDSWAWDVDGDGDFSDYQTQNVDGHIYTVPDGANVDFTVSIEASRLSEADVETKTDIITVFGKPIADFGFVADGLLVDFSNTSIEPGKSELGGFSYAWDLDNDGQYDDSLVESPSWTFPGYGDYEVSYMITNGAGTSYVEKTVAIVPEPSVLVLLTMASFLLVVFKFKKNG